MDIVRVRVVVLGLGPFRGGEARCRPPVATISCSPKIRAGKKEVKNMNVVADRVTGWTPYSMRG